MDIVFLEVSRMFLICTGRYFSNDFYVVDGGLRENDQHYYHSYPDAEGPWLLVDLEAPAVVNMITFISRIDWDTRDRFLAVEVSIPIL